MEILDIIISILYKLFSPLTQTLPITQNFLHFYIFKKHHLLTWFPHEDPIFPRRQFMGTVHLNHTHTQSCFPSTLKKKYPYKDKDFRYCHLCGDMNPLKVIVHFEINFWYVLAYLKGIQDVGVFVSTVVEEFRCKSL